jgi:hypothetical protein
VITQTCPHCNSARCKRFGTNRHPKSQQPRHDSSQRSPDRGGAPGANSQRGIARTLKVARLTIRNLRKKRCSCRGADRRRPDRAHVCPLQRTTSSSRPPQMGRDTQLVYPCHSLVTLSPWLWAAVSRQVGQVLGFVIGNRTDAMLALCWSDVPQDHRDKPVCTDHWGAYGRFFAGSQRHEAFDKGRGKTSHSAG